MQGSFFCNSKAKDLYIECEATSCTDGLLKCLISGKGGGESAPPSAWQAIGFFFLLGALHVLPLKKSFICWVCRPNQGNLCRICRLETWIRVQTKQSFLPLFWLIICLPCYCRGCHSSLFSHRTVWKWNAAGQIAWLRLPQIPLHIQAPEPICAGRTDGQCEPPPPLPYNLMSLVGSRISAALFVCIQCRCLPRILSVQIFMRIPQRERTQNRESKDPK